MWLPPFARDIHPAVQWTALALALFLGFRIVLPPFPALAPLWATCGVLLAAAVLQTMRRRLALRSLAFLFIAALAYLFAWNRGIPMLYAFTAACLGIVVVSHVLPRWTLRRLVAKVSAPPWLSQGDAAEIAVEVSNPGNATLRMLEVEVPVEGTVADAAPACSLLVQLKAGASRRLLVRTPPLRRGRRFAGSVAVRTGFPLGLVIAEDRVPDSGRHIWVYPRLFDVAFVPIAGEQFLDMGDAISPRSGGVEEFAGVREYRHGDSSRHVHWRASAKRGELVVKEFMRRSAATVTIAVDMRESACFGEGIETTTEYAVRIAASVARYALDHGHYVQLAYGGSNFESVGPLRGMGALENAMRSLALAKVEGSATPGTWLTRIAALAPPDSTVVLAYVDHDLGSVEGLAALRAKNVLVVPFAVDADSFGRKSRPVASSPLPTRARIRRIARGEDPAAMFRK